MTVFRLDHRMIFPAADLADESGLLAVGGDLSAARLLLAYRMGIFPWYDEGLPIMWHSPDPRMVLLPKDLYVNRSLRKALRRAPYRITLDTAFSKVVRECAGITRTDQDGTWITGEMAEAYTELHRQGHAHSVEAWLGDDLVGGLYGISLGSAFFGESMFSKASNASKISFVSLIGQLERWNFSMVDCQVHTDHLEHFGAIEIPREEFQHKLRVSLQAPSRVGPWSFSDEGLLHTKRG